jgi:hypothetical protein
MARLPQNSRVFDSLILMTRQPRPKEAKLAKSQQNFEVVTRKFPLGLPAREVKCRHRQGRFIVVSPD